MRIYISLYIPDGVHVFDVIVLDELPFVTKHWGEKKIWKVSALVYLLRGNWAFFLLYFINFLRPSIFARTERVLATNGLFTKN